MTTLLTEHTEPPVKIGEPILFESDDEIPPHERQTHRRSLITLSCPLCGRSNNGGYILKGTPSGPPIRAKITKIQHKNTILVAGPPMLLSAISIQQSPLWVYFRFFSDAFMRHYFSVRVHSKIKDALWSTNSGKNHKNPA